MYLKKVLECLEESLASKDGVIEMYRRENRELREELEKLREAKKGADAE